MTVSCSLKLKSRSQSPLTLLESLVYKKMDAQLLKIQKVKIGVTGETISIVKKQTPLGLTRACHAHSTERVLDEQ